MADGTGWVGIDCNSDWTFSSINITTEVNMTRKRYLELIKVAKELCEFLEKKDITHDEGCKVRKLAEELWEMK